MTGEAIRHEASHCGSGPRSRLIQQIQKKVHECAFLEEHLSEEQRILLGKARGGAFWRDRGSLQWRMPCANG